MGLPDILKVHFLLIPMMYVLCLVGFCPGILDIWLTSKGQLFRVYFLVCTGYGTQKKDGCGNFNLNFKSNINHNIAVIMTAEPSWADMVKIAKTAYLPTNTNPQHHQSTIAMVSPWRKHCGRCRLAMMVILFVWQHYSLLLPEPWPLCSCKHCHVFSLVFSLTSNWIDFGDSHQHLWTGGFTVPMWKTVY